MAYSSSGVLDTQSNISPDPHQILARAERVRDPLDSDTSVATDDIHLMQLFVLRFAGALCLIFGSIELGLGGSLYDFFSDMQIGAWWSAILVVTAGF